MHRVRKVASVGRVLGAALVMAAGALPVAGAEASTPVDAAGLLSPALDCAAISDTSVGTGGFLAWVRAEGATKRRHLAVPRQKDRRGDHVAPRPTQPRAKTPPLAQEARPALLRSLYTCNAPASPDLGGDTGWRLVGPLRQG